MMRHSPSNVLKTAAMVLVLAALAFVPAAASAQSATAVSDGTSFAKSIAPTSSAQIVNPTGVNSTAWAGNATTPTVVPSTLGKFSTPNVSTNPYTSAKAIGLAGYGNQAVANCAAYDPTTGDPTQSQTCAAINFLSNRCLSPTTHQSAVMSANATSATPLAADCAGTYGQAQANYGYSEQESSSDSIFTSISGLSSTASGTIGETCSIQTVVTTPAQYASYTCTKNDSSDEYTCYQYLNASVQTTYTPAQTTTTCTAPAVLQSGYCVAQTSSPALVVYGCPPGEVLNGETCVTTSSTPATPIYSCPPGSTLDGTKCDGQSTVPPISSNNCPTISGSIQQGYVPGTLDGITGYCQYLWWQLDFGDESNCARVMANRANGATLFATATILPTGRFGIRTACYTYPERVCPSGSVWNGSACEQPATSDATITGYSCTTGTLSGSVCVVTTSNPADPTYQCPTGTQLSGSVCVSTTSSPPNVTYSCPNGSVPKDGLCITNYVVMSWVDACSPYEASANITLPTPH